MIIIVFGLPGSGKSFFASQLAHNLRAEYVNTDQLRMKLFTTRTYTNEEKLIVYEKMFEAMQRAIKNRINLVLDGTFYRDFIRKKFQNESKEKEPLEFIEVVAGDAVIRERLAKPRALSEADFEVYNKIMNEWEPMDEEHLIINSTNNNISEMMKKAEDYLHRHDK